MVTSAVTTGAWSDAGNDAARGQVAVQIVSGRKRQAAGRGGELDQFGDVASLPAPGEVERHLIGDVDRALDGDRSRCGGRDLEVAREPRPRAEDRIATCGEPRRQEEGRPAARARLELDGGLDRPAQVPAIERERPAEVDGRSEGDGRRVDGCLRDHDPGPEPCSWRAFDGDLGDARELDAAGQWREPNRELERTGAGIKVLEPEWVQGEDELDSGRAGCRQRRLQGDKDLPIGHGGVGLHAGSIQGHLPVAAADRDRFGGGGEPGTAARLESGDGVDSFQNHPGGKLLRGAGEGVERGEIQSGPGDADLAGNRAAEVAEVGVECEGGGVASSPQRDGGARHLEQTGLEGRGSKLGATGVGRENGLETVETKPRESAAGHLEEGSVGLDPCDRERLELGQQRASAHLQALDHRLTETLHLQATDPDLAPKTLRQRALDSEAGEIAGQP